MGCSGQQVHFAATGAMHGHGLLNLTPTAFNHLGPTYRAHPDTTAGLQTPITGRLVVLGLPDLHVLGMGANAQAFCSSGIQGGCRGQQTEARSVPPRRSIGFTGGAGNFALIPRAAVSRPARAFPAGGDPFAPPAPGLPSAKAAAIRAPSALWLVAWGEICAICADFCVSVIRFACRLCCPSILQKPASPGTVPSVRGAFLFQDAEMGCASFFSA